MALSANQQSSILARSVSDISTITARIRRQTNALKRVADDARGPSPEKAPSVDVATENSLHSAIEALAEATDHLESEMSRLFDSEVRSNEGQLNAPR